MAQRCCCASRTCEAGGWGGRGGSLQELCPPPTTPTFPPPHRFDAGEDPVLSLPATVDLATLLPGWPLASALDMTLPASLPLAAVPRQTYRTDAGGLFEVPVLPPAPAGPGLTVTLGPQETRTFICTLA